MSKAIQNEVGANWWRFRAAQERQRRIRLIFFWAIVLILVGIAIAFLTLAR